MNVRFPGGKRVVAEHDGMVIETDQPRAAGGDGSAPSPFELFLASLATCAGYYVLAFCQRRGIPTEEISLSLSTVRDEDRHMLERITIDVHLPAAFPEKYVDACVKSASQCTVKRHLLDPPEVIVAVDRRAAAG